MKDSILRNLMFFLGMLLTSLAISNCLSGYVMRVSGYSMFPTFVTGEYLINNTFDKHYSRGEIVTFTDLESGETWVKRVTAVAGDNIRIDPESNAVYLNGEKLEENYIHSKHTYIEELNITVPEGHIFVLGDNRDNSKDSRYVGCINTCNVKGSVIRLRFTDKNR